MTTKNDKQVLNTIFNPFEPNFNDENITIHKTCPLEYHKFEPNDEKNLKELKHLELEGVKLAEQGKLNESLEIFNKLINDAPTYSSAFNNRGQVYQLKGDVQLALSDINKAIDLANIKGCKCADNNKVLAQALCQRALIYRFQKDETRSYIDFKQAASLGNEFAKKQVIKLNPYAALCNSMLNQMINKLRNGENDRI